MSGRHLSDGFSICVSRSTPRAKSSGHLYRALLSHFETAEDPLQGDVSFMNESFVQLNLIILIFLDSVLTNDQKARNNAGPAACDYCWVLSSGCPLLFGASRLPMFSLPFLQLKIQANHFISSRESQRIFELSET